MKIDSVNIIGTGNVGTHLIAALANKGILRNVYTRSAENAQLISEKFSVEVVTDIQRLSSKVNLNIVSTKDDSIIDVIKHLPKNIPIAHTSGTVEINVLKDFQNSGILYPLQTLSKEHLINLDESTFLIEANTADFYKVLDNFCSENISRHVVSADSESRKVIHLAAVFSNNFVNNMLAAAELILKEKNMDFRLLEPLIKESVRKALDIGPLKAQTGPAIRNDEKTTERHLEMIDDQLLKNIYQLVSENIKRYGEV